jgi:hypothetical protein
MNMIGKFATGIVAVAAFGAIIFASTSADSMKPAQSGTVVAKTDAPQASGPLNSKETLQDQLSDLQYN